MQEIHTSSFDNLSDFYKDKLWTLTVYFNSLKDLGKCATLISDDVISHIRIMASRFGNPNSGRRVFGVDELTSRKSTTELNETLDKLEKTMYSSNDEYRNKGVSSVLIATNMISVGIDIARLNVMLMVGQPKLTSEYIQASSRVGRSYPGVVFAMYDGSKSRDRSHYEQFKSYHESFYKYVEPTGATPFSKPARDRALHAVAIALMRYMVPDLNDELAAGAFRKEKYAKEIDFITNVLTTRSKDIANRLNSSMIDDSEEIREEIMNVFDTWEARAGEYKDKSFAYGNKYMVKSPTEDEGRLMKVFNTSPKDNKPFDTMTSMRNVDSSVAASIIVWE
jgi:superfamily II DNA/RNA helicase